MFVNSKKFVKRFDKILKILTKIWKCKVNFKKLLKMQEKFDVDLIKLRILQKIQKNWTNYYEI